MKRNPLHGEKKNPTKKHRPAIWENMLGTVYARNDAGETRYFDYDWYAAREFAGVDEEGRDPRVARLTDSVRRAAGYFGGAGTMAPRDGQVILWVRKR